MTDRIAPDRLAMMVEASDLDDLPWSDGSTPTRNGATGRKPCSRHEWEWRGPGLRVCRRCEAVRDPDRSRRGSNNRSRGNAVEREVAKKLGLRRVGQYGGKDDVAGDLFAAQVKSGGSFSERYWNWLKAVPVNSGQTALLVVTDAPGPGHKRRAVVVLDLEDWRDLHGEPKP